MTDSPVALTGTVEHFPAFMLTTPVTDELNKILTMLRAACPDDAIISFDFDGHLHVHVDVRKREHVTLVEMVLPAIGRGLFHGLSRAATPHHPFYHRVSALVAS